MINLKEKYICFFLLFLFGFFFSMKAFFSRIMLKHFSSFIVVKQMSKDWVSGNWYFADEVKEQIFLCTSDGSYCMSVIHNGVRRPKCLALDPTKGWACIDKGWLGFMLDLWKQLATSFTFLEKIFTLSLHSSPERFVW